MTFPRLVAGAMSGTSADGVDVAIVRISGRGSDMSATLVHHQHRPYEPVLREEISRARSGQPVSLSALAQLGQAISLVYAATANEALLAAGLHAADLDCLAAHGQTLFHAPPLTIQWLDPALLAAEVGCAVVSDFRRADCAAGGQGAPLVPFADYVLFRSPTHTRVLLNIGGIANLTYLPGGGGADSVRAWDSGPGNCMSDWLVRELRPAGPAYDAEGALASCGQVDQAAVDAVLADPYFKQSPPKSTDGPAMIGAFQTHYGRRLHENRLADLLATACRISAEAIVRAIRSLPHQPHELIASGGGIHNRAMMGYIRASLPDVHVASSDEHGVSGQAKEAIAFALLGAATLDGLPSNIPTATGAKRPVVLGSITPKP